MILWTRGFDRWRSLPRETGWSLCSRSRSRNLYL